jgi:peptidoglycan/LPS O-acetylase OafA/YrhL
MLQGFLGLPSVDGVYWILQIELTFYAVMLALFVIKQLKRVEVLAIVWLAAAALDHYLSTRLEIHIPGSYTLLLGGYVGFFTAGIMFCRIRNSQAL